MDSITLIGIDKSLVLAGICAFYGYRCVMLLRDTNITGVGIELTKNRQFLSTNFMFIMVIAGLSALQILLGQVEEQNLISASYTHDVITVIYYLDLSGAMLALLLLTIAWYRLLLKVNTWDTRWIKAKQQQGRDEQEADRACFRCVLYHACCHNNTAVDRACSAVF